MAAAPASQEVHAGVVLTGLHLGFASLVRWHSFTWMLPLKVRVSRWDSQDASFGWSLHAAGCTSATRCSASGTAGHTPEKRLGDEGAGAGDEDDDGEGEGEADGAGAGAGAGDGDGEDTGEDGALLPQLSHVLVGLHLGFVPEVR